MNKSWWWIAGFIIVSMLLGVGVLLLVTRPPRGKPIELLPPPTPAPITIYVTGEVNKSGLYLLAPGSRVNDAIIAAGGFTENANNSVINLAALLEDGDQIKVPGRNSPSVTESGSGLLNQSTTLVDINSASLEELDTLPEIGPKTAQDIIDYRNANGPFKKIEDILDVPGIGEATFNRIKSLITTGTSP